MSDLACEHRTLESFFFEEIEAVEDRTGSDLPPEVEAYVVHLLAEYARRPTAAGRSSRPLALDYLAAQQHSGTARAHALRGVGDRALYISGVVPHSLQRTPVKVTYVQSIGEAAYREVAHGNGPLVVFSLLANTFATVSDIIAEIVDPACEDSPEDVLDLYERWRRSGDPRDARRLLRAGVLLDPEGSDILQ